MVEIREFAYQQHHRDGYMELSKLVEAKDHDKFYDAFREFSSKAYTLREEGNVDILTRLTLGESELIQSSVASSSRLPIPFC